MASSPVHLTLSAGVASTVTFVENFARVEVLNVDGAAIVYFTNDASTPTVGGNGCHVVPAALGAALEVDDETVGVTVVKLISAGTPKVSVRGVL